MFNLRTQLVECKRLGKITVKDSWCGYIDIREKGDKKRLLDMKRDIPYM